MSRKLFAVCVFAAVITLGGPLRRAAAADVRDVLGMLTADEQRVLHSMRADPRQDSQLKSDLNTALASKNDAKAFEAAKRRFQVAWLTRINDFSGKYSNNDQSLMGSMDSLPKPNAEDARTRLPWFAEIDNKGWGGKMIPGVIQALNPYEAAYTLNSMRSFNEAQRKEVIDQLNQASSWSIPIGSVIPKMIAATKKTYGDDMTVLQGNNASRVADAKGALAKLEQDLLARAPAPVKETDLGGSKTAKEQLERVEKTMDGARRSVERGDAPNLENAKGRGGVFDGVGIIGGEPEGSVVVVDEAATGKENLARLQPSGSTGGGDLILDDIPPPPAPEGKVASESGSKLGMMLKSPYVGAGLGGILMGVLGFLLGGPVGALIGVAVGAAAGYFLVKKLA